MIRRLGVDLLGTIWLALDARNGAVFAVGVPDLWAVTTATLAAMQSLWSGVAEASLDPG